MTSSVRLLLICEKAAAAAEMALVLPLMIILLFGGFEVGNYFLSQHTLTTAVRDGARFAARQGFSQFSGCAASSGVVSAIKNVTRTGQIANGTTLIRNWTDAETSVSISCNAGTTTGIYTNMASGAPVVTVSATLPYSSLFGGLIFSGSTNLKAESKSAVMGF